MRWVRDKTGRFPQRPHYDPLELDYACESAITEFLSAKYGSPRYPVSTNDLEILVEGETQDFDLYADLSHEEGDIEGMTVVIPGQRPKVYISKLLSEDARRENRLRTTLTHELGHVKFHSPLGKWTAPRLFEEEVGSIVIRCKRETMLEARVSDWMEWQAGYASGAFLIPISALARFMGAFSERHGTTGPVALTTPEGRELIGRLAFEFQVSHDAARVRLMQRGYVTAETSPQRVLG